MKRVILFLLTNLAVLAVLSVIVRALEAARIVPQGALGVSLVSAAVIGMLGSFVSLAISKPLAKWSVRARTIEIPSNDLESWLFHTVHRLARVKGIAAPELAVYETYELNAFATGMSKNHALVAVSTGLVSRMRREEIEAILGHEISHVANGDMVTLALMQGVLNTFVLFFSRLIGEVVDTALLRREHGADRRHGPAFWFVMFVAELVLGILATMVVMWFSRLREYRADAGSAELVGARKMIHALEGLSREADLAPLPDSLRAFGIRGSVAPNSLTRLFSTHPPIDERIRALREGLTGWPATRRTRAAR